jgi:hypothetical protein
MTNLTPANIEILNPINYPGWDDLLLSNPNSTFFHTSAWAKVLWETYGYKPLYFTLVDGGRLMTMIPVMEVRSIITGFRGVSLPFSDHCEPLTTMELQAQDIIDFVGEYACKRHWKYIESRGGQYPGIAPSRSFYEHTLNLTIGTEELFSRFIRHKRKNIRKAIREGVVVNIYTSLEALKEYYRLHCITRKRHGVPPQPYSFFKKIHEHIILRDLGFIALAAYNKTNIGGCIFFNFGKKALWKFGASDRAYQHLRPNDILAWEVMKLYVEKGYQSLCFGRTSLNNTSLRRYKVEWGTDEQIINYYKYDLRHGIFVNGESFAVDRYCFVLGRMPIPLLRLLGWLLYKHIG